jgi:hypothetical protein
MKILIRGRRHGKTLESVEWVLRHAQEGAVLIVMNERERHRILHDYPDLSESQVMTFYSSKGGGFRGSYHFNTVAIDNLDLILEELFNCPIGLITLSGEGVRVYDETSPSN